MSILNSNSNTDPNPFMDHLVDHREPYLCQTRTIKDPLGFHTIISKIIFVLVHLGLLLSGIIVLLDQYRDITHCEGHYRVWGIIITIFYGGLTLASYWRWSWFISMVPRDRAIWLLLVSLCPLLISTTGYYYVVEVPDGCHTENIGQITRWSLAVVVFNSGLTLLLWLASLGLCYVPGRFKTNTTLLDLSEVEVQDDIGSDLGSDLDPKLVAYL